MIFGFVMLLLGKQLYANVQISNYHLASWPSRTNLMHICCLNPSGYLHGVKVIMMTPSSYTMARLRALNGVNLASNYIF